MLNQGFPGCRCMRPARHRESLNFWLSPGPPATRLYPCHLNSCKTRSGIRSRVGRYNARRNERHARNSDAEKSVKAENDEQLMVAFSQGSTDEFGELFSRYKQPLFGFF